MVSGSVSSLPTLLRHLSLLMVFASSWILARSVCVLICSRMKNIVLLSVLSRDSWCESLRRVGPSMLCEDSLMKYLVFLDTVAEYFSFVGLLSVKMY